jgi:D-alanyl-D-alanine dipeptidase
LRRYLFLALIAVLLLSRCGAPAAPVPPLPADSVTPEAPAEAKPLPEPEPAPVPEPAPADLVAVVDYIPGIYTELRYASDNNFTHQVIYSFSDAYLRYGTVQKLASAQESLETAGYSLLIWDAFRPVSAQFKLWEICPDPAYVANPEKGYSSHSRGSTVDITLVTANGQPVDMPTDFDDFTALADRDYSDVGDTAAANARLLESAMTAAGFRPYSAEWWHYSDTQSYPVDEQFIPLS